MKAAIYARVSLDKKAEDPRSQDPQNQIEPLRKWAKTLSYELIEIYIDKCSGGDNNRPEFQRMIADARQRKFGVVLVWSLDRFSREGISKTLAYLQRLRVRGVGVKALQDANFDTTKDSMVGDLIISILAWAAGYERQRISERTKAGIARRKAIGQYKGGRPKGAKDKRPRKKKTKLNADLDLILEGVI